MNGAEEFLKAFKFDKIISCEEFCEALFEGTEMEEEYRRDIFRMFDRDRDGALKEAEWLSFCNWLSALVEPVSVLLIVDVQNDFIDGTLALRNFEGGQDPLDIIAPINRIVEKANWDKVVYTLDYHPEDHISFYDNLHLREVHPDSKVKKSEAKPFDTVLFSVPYVEQKLWPRHCLVNSWGAQLHKDLVLAPSSEQVKKGLKPDRECYSAFAETDANGSSNLERLLSEVQATHLYVCGIALDVCVKATCLDALSLGYTVALIEDCSAAVNPQNARHARELIVQKGGLLTNSGQVLSLLNEREIVPRIVENVKMYKYTKSL